MDEHATEFQNSHHGPILINQLLMTIQEILLEFFECHQLQILPLLLASLHAVPLEEIVEEFIEVGEMHKMHRPERLPVKLVAVC